MQENKQELTSVVRGLWALLKPYQSQVKKTLLWIVANELLNLVEPTIMMLLIDQISRQGAAPMVDHLAFMGMIVGAFMIYALFYLAARLKNMWVHRVVNQLEYDIMVDCTERLLHMPASAFQQDNPGKVIGRLKEGIGQSIQTIWDLAFGLLPVVASFVIVTAVLFASRFQAGLAVTLVLLAFGWTEYKSRQKTRGMRKDLADLREDVDSSVAQALDNIETVQAFGQEQREHNRITNLWGMKRDLENKEFALTLNWDMAHQLIFVAGRLVVLCLCAYALFDKSLTLGELFFVLQLASRSFEGAKGLSRTWRKLVQSEEPIRRTLQILTTPMPEEEEAEETEEGERVDGGLELRHVSFGYPAIGPDGEPLVRPGPTVLRDLSLTIDPKSYVAVVGLSGCGKTTLLNLISGALQPTQGQILADGCALNEIPRKAWRAKVGMLGQAQLFSTSVAKNISYGHHMATQDEIVAAAQKAQADLFIDELPDGYRQQIGNKGARLSAGQKQRLCLARALLGDPAILLLDEPLNHLDIQSAAEVMQSIRALRGSCTIMHVTHQLWSIADADLIVVMDQGRIAEQGTHRQLLAKRGLYSILFEKQRLQYREIDILGMGHFVC